MRVKELGVRSVMIHTEMLEPIKIGFAKAMIDASIAIVFALVALESPVAVIKKVGAATIDVF